MTLYGGIEAGGTKFSCAVASNPDDVKIISDFPTTTPAETLPRIIHFLSKAQKDYGQLAGIGIASFGPVDLHPDSPSFGHITKTPKAGWTDVDIVGMVREFNDLPIGFDTDVNGAALAEHRWGAAIGLDTFIYLTIGTGIGGGGLVGGNLMHGLIHPEMGHLRVPHDWQADPFPGACPYHGDCLEGMASGLSIEKRWGISAKELEADHPAWDLEVEYLSLGFVNIICTVSPQRLILGGGVMKQLHLFPRIRHRVQELLNNYVYHPSIQVGIDDFIIPPKLGTRAGVFGAIALAQSAVNLLEE